MSDNSLLWRLSSQDAARLIILEPIEHVPRRRFWHKRPMSIRSSRKNKPRVDDLKRLSKAAWDRYWDEFHKDWDEEFQKLIGKAPSGPVTNPLIGDNQVPLYAYGELDLMEDLDYFEEARAYLWLRFIRGQIGEGPRLDALIYLKMDSLLRAEIDRAKYKFKLTQQAIAAKRLAKRAKRSQAPRQEIWHNIGDDEEIALQFRHSGHTVRKIDTLTNRHWEVLVQ